MTDKELLELAAKAAGYEWRKDIAEYRDDRGISGLWIIEPMMTGWNPLTDDGDALRLAVTLKLDIWQGDNESGVVIKMPASFHEPRGNDPYAATRRAIVRAAAEIGAGKTGEGS